jgi:two-component system, LytTR family, response regulator
VSADRFRVLIVDDERPARQKVRRFLGGDPCIEAIFEAPDGLRALQLIRDESPDVVFLDVQMPGLDGFGVAEALAPDVSPHLVFVTAFDQYAVRAFDVHAVDYLVKPFDEKRFRTALERAKSAHLSRAARSGRGRVLRLLDDVQSRRPTTPDRILVDAGDRMLLVPLDRIDRIVAFRNYLRIHAGKETYRQRGTISRMEERLDPARFVRISRSEIVNVARISALKPWSHGDRIVVLADGTTTRLSRRYRDRLDHFSA